MSSAGNSASMLAADIADLIPEIDAVQDTAGELLVMADNGQIVPLAWFLFNTRRLKDTFSIIVAALQKQALPTSIPSNAARVGIVLRDLEADSQKLVDKILKIRLIYEEYIDTEPAIELLFRAVNAHTKLMMLNIANAKEAR